MRRKNLVLAVALLLVGTLVTFMYSKSRSHITTILVSTPELQSVHIGSFTDRKEATRKAIQELNRQIILHPQSSQYEAHYLDESNLDFYYSRLVYNSTWQTLLWKYSEAPRTIVSPPQWEFVPHFLFFIKSTKSTKSTERAYSDYDFGDSKDAVVTKADIGTAAEHGWSLEELTNASKKFHNSSSDPRR